MKTGRPCHLIAFMAATAQATKVAHRAVIEHVTPLVPSTPRYHEVRQPFRAHRMPSILKAAKGCAETTGVN
jgi:hypothetical protein